jgi:hypothetical protein
MSHHLPWVRRSLVALLAGAVLLGACRQPAPQAPKRRN